MVLPKHELEGKLGEETALIESSALRDENPLEESDEFNQLILTCRKGDLRRCQELISQGVNINAKDRFDCTPLIIVSLPARRPTRAEWENGRPASVGIMSLSSCY